MSKTMGLLEDVIETNSTFNNCSTADSFVIFHASNEVQHDEAELKAAASVDETKSDTNISHLKTFTTSKDENERSPKLNFPKISSDGRYKISSLHLDKGIFIFEFLRKFLSFILPYDVPVDLLIDAIEQRIDMSKLISETIHLEAVLLAVIGLCCILCCIVPGTELWLACRPIRDDYRPIRHPSVLVSLLALLIFVLGCGMITMIVCNEAVSTSVQEFPITAEASLHDLNDFHSNTALQLRKRLSGSLDVASEAILADIDSIEELLGKPIQSEISAETGLDVALNTLIDLANGTQEVSRKVTSLLNKAENARNLGTLLSVEVDDMRRNLRSALSACTGHDRPLCSTIDISGLRMTLRLDQLVREDRLLRLRNLDRQNLTEIVRQARGEYFYIPQYIARNTLDVRNQIRHEINRMRARIFDEARNMEATNSDFIKQLEVARRVVDSVTPYIIVFEHIRWLIGIGAVICIVPIWMLLLGVLFCRCSACEDKVRPALLCAVFMTCIVSVALWIVIIVSLILSSHTEMLICRPLHDPNYHTVEAILESKKLVGRKLSVPLKELFEKCKGNETAYSAFGLGNSLILEQLTAYWTWSSFSKLLLQIKLDLKAVRIFTPYLQQHLVNLQHACEWNLTEHRIMVQRPVMNKSLDDLSYQVDKIAHEMSDRMTARSLETIAMNLQDLTSKRLKPLVKLQDELVYMLAGLELQMQPLKKQIEQAISHMKAIEYYINNQGNNMAQLKTKMYEDRLSNYLDQWRSHVLSELSGGVAMCRPIWDVLQGIRALLCGHFLGNLSGYWFATVICSVIMILCTPVAHILSLVYKNPPASLKDIASVPIQSESTQTTSNGQETWNIPEPPPAPQEGW